MKDGGSNETMFHDQDLRDFSGGCHLAAPATDEG
jgi:hypothetical protein